MKMRTLTRSVLRRLVAFLRGDERDRAHELVASVSRADLLKALRENDRVAIAVRWTGEGDARSASAEIVPA